MTRFPLPRAGVAALLAALPALPAFAHPGHGHLRPDTVLASLRHLLTEPEHVLWIGLGVAAVVAALRLARGSDR